VPTYQYACTDCAERLEAVQKFSDDPLTVCPSCGGKLRKVFSPVGIVFKGSGFYRTDSRADRKGSEAPAASSNGSDGKKKSGDSGSSTDKPSTSGEKKADKPASSPASASSGSKVA
jgi:putative FmdB family regulatory protein